MIIFHGVVQSNNVMSIMGLFPEILQIFQDNKKGYLINSSSSEVNLPRKWFIDSKSALNSILNLKLVLELKKSYLTTAKNVNEVKYFAPGLF